MKVVVTLPLNGKKLRLLIVDTLLDCVDSISMENLFALFPEYKKSKRKDMCLGDKNHVKVLMSDIVYRCINHKI